MRSSAEFVGVFYARAVIFSDTKRKSAPHGGNQRSDSSTLSLSLSYLKSVIVMTL